MDIPTEQNTVSHMESENNGRRKATQKLESNPYARFLNDEMILRDQLAVDRTILANERTLLAYIRTLLALVLAGATVIRIFEDPALNNIGWALIVVGVLIGGIGILRTRRTSRRIRATQKEPTRPDGASRFD